MGCVSRALEPQRSVSSVSSISSYEFVPPPAPKTIARPATLGACQVRLQLSMLLLPMTRRANFCAMKFISFVLFEQLKQPKALPVLARKPFAARFPGIDLRWAPSGRRAHVMGTGLAAWELFMIWKHHGGNVKRILKNYPHLTPAQIHAGASYMHAYPEEMPDLSPPPFMTVVKI